MRYKIITLTSLLFLGSGLKMLDAQTVTDIEGNIYRTMTIGTQTWMTENLKVTTYNDGTVIPLVTDGNMWAIPSTPGYCWYNNDESGYKDAYGALYNWFALDSATTGGRNVCPAGWRVPTNLQWTILTDYLENNGYGYEKSGNDIAKSMASASGWTPDLNAGNVGNDQAGNNSSGFDALPGGFRDFDGTFDCIGGYGGWWCATQYDADNAWSGAIVYSSSNTGIYDYSKQVGYSVRCVKE
jgi:uncharacterized protein (TIGR02145 family)